MDLTSVTGALRRSVWRLRFLLAVPMVLLAIGVVSRNGDVRIVEAHASASITAVITGADSQPMDRGHGFIFGIGTPKWFGLSITPDCSSSYMVGPMLGLVALLMLCRRFSIRRILTGGAIAAAILFAFNVGRVVFIAWATFNWGPERGYAWSHAIGGSLITMIGGLVALCTLLLIVFHGTKKAPPLIPAMAS